MAHDETTEIPPGEGKADNLLNDFAEISIVEIALVILVAYGTILAARLLIPPLAERVPSRVRLWLLGAVPIIRLLMLTGAILWIIPIIFNITFQNFLVIAGAASVAIGFAFKDYVSSIIAGIVAVFERPYRPGDWVSIGGDYGEVREVGLRAITIVTAADNVITVPHDRLWKENISNSNDGDRTLMCVADFWVAPDHDARKLRASLRDVALTSAYLDYDRPVLVVLSETPFGTHYKVKAYPFEMREQFAFISDLTVRGKEALHDCGARAAMPPASMTVS